MVEYHLVVVADPSERMTLKNVLEHPWVMEEEGHVPEYICFCKRRNSALKIEQEEEEEEANGISNISDAS